MNIRTDMVNSSLECCRKWVLDQGLLGQYKHLYNSHSVTWCMPRVKLHVMIDFLGMDVPLKNPVIKPYYRDGFGSKSIGEPEWRPHPRNALSVPGRLDNTAK